MRHPAKYSEALMPVLATALTGCTRILDPFAGTGRVHSLNGMISRRGYGGKREPYDVETVGVEIEPEWAEMHPQTIVGDALNLPFDDETFDGMVTSPTYANRMADHHDAQDGSERHTYRHYLGRPLSPNNSGQLQWGDAYRAFHYAAWREASRVLRPGGRLVLNIKDHIRGGERIRVTDWHKETLLSLGFMLVQELEVHTPGQRHGANGSERIDYESVLVFMKPVAGNSIVEDIRLGNGVER